MTNKFRALVAVAAAARREEGGGQAAEKMSHCARLALMNRHPVSHGRRDSRLISVKAPEGRLASARI
jgi:hypothetical protein